MASAASTRSRHGEAKGALLEAAVTAIRTRGLHATSIDSLCSAAGVTKGAFFHHFGSKSDLALALVERYAALDRTHLEANLARAEKLASDPLQQVLGQPRAHDLAVAHRVQVASPWKQHAVDEGQPFIEGGVLENVCVGPGQQ